MTSRDGVEEEEMEGAGKSEKRAVVREIYIMRHSEPARAINPPPLRTAHSAHSR